MAIYILKRLLQMIFVVFFSAIIIFTIMYFVPGDPAQLILGMGAKASALEAKRQELGLNDSYFVQLGHFLNRVFLHFDLGISYQRGQSVTQLVLDRLPRTMIIGFISVIVGTMAGILLGVMAATHQGKIRDGVALFIAMVGFAAPAYWLTIEMVVLFALKLHWLPGFGVGGWTHYVIPTLGASMGGIGIVTRQTRSSVLETMRADYVQSARAKGASERRVVYRHILPNALIPVITVTGMSFAMVLTGLIIIEMVFSIPGVGLLLMNGIMNRDYPVIQGVVIILSLISTTVMLLTDLAYGFVDPRIKAQYKGTGRV